MSLGKVGFFYSEYREVPLQLSSCKCVFQKTKQSILLASARMSGLCEVFLG